MRASLKGMTAQLVKAGSALDLQNKVCISVRFCSSCVCVCVGCGLLREKEGAENKCVCVCARMCVYKRLMWEALCRHHCTWLPRR